MIVKPHVKEALREAEAVLINKYGSYLLNDKEFLYILGKLYEKRREGKET